MTEKLRTIKYRRVVWNNSTSQAIDQLLLDAHTKLDTSKKRTFKYKTGELQGLRFRKLKNEKGILLHIAYYVPGEDASVVPKPSDSPDAEVGITSPPDGTDFMEGDIMLFLKDNHIIICQTSIHETAVLVYLSEVLRKSGYQNEYNSFTIQKIADSKKVELIQKEGVKAVILNTGLYAATVDYITRKTQKTKLFNFFATGYEACFENDNDPDLRGLDPHENLNVHLKISYDSRYKNGTIGKKRILKTAEHLIDEEEGDYTIETFSGKKITPSELSVSKRVNITGHGKSVNYQQTWHKLVEYYDDLSKTGILEE